MNFLEFFVMMAVIAMGIVVMKAIMSDCEKDELSELSKAFGNKIKKSFDKKISKDLIKAFRRQCRAARGEIRHFNDLVTGSDSLWLSSRNGSERFYKEFLTYAEGIANMEITTEKAVVDELLKGQKILKSFEQYLDDMAILKGGD
ncbi:hypothetical protein IKG73_01020 [Candidatus Saccharibacteria bacterium]|nr:hypothetical protein [Candidatus Saccharibacteria bacterium]